TLTGLSLCIGILGGSWGVTQYLSNRVMVLSEQVRQGKTALEQLPKGWTFAKDMEAEYIVLDSKKKPTVNVYQSKGGDWIIRVKSMTELEKHLLKAFKHLEASYNEQQSALNQAQSDLRTMFERTSQENQALQQHVTSLTEQVSSLSGQVQQLARLYSTNKR